MDEERKKVITKSGIAKKVYRGYKKHVTLFIFFSVVIVAVSVGLCIGLYGEYQEGIKYINEEVKAQVLLYNGKYFLLFAFWAAVSLVVTIYTAIQARKLYMIQKKGIRVEIDDIIGIERWEKKTKYGYSEELALIFYKYGRYLTGLPYSGGQYRFEKGDKFYVAVSNTEPHELLSVYSIEKYEYKDE